MRIKTFQGRSLDEVLPEIRAELGEGAVVIGQRSKVQGGVAGFFGTKVIEVTAADRMPDDEQLVDLEDQLMNGGDGGSSAGSKAGGDPTEAALAERFAGAMRMGRRGGIDVTDEWDPSQDSELADEYGRVLEHAAAAHEQFTGLDVPTAERTIPADPMAQAQLLAQRAHQHVRQATNRMDEAVYAPQMTASATYAPPRALPVEGTGAQTFAASVHDTAMQAYEPQAVATPASAAGTVEAALRNDLALPAPARTTGDDLADAIDAAVDMIDLKAMAALRNAMHASRRAQEQEARTPLVDADVELDVARVTEQLTGVGVDDDVVSALVDVALRHRRPFAAHRSVDELVRDVIEDTIDVRSGFPTLGRTHRIAVVGASSSGKTTVVSKLAAGYVAAGMRVGILSIIAADPSVALMADPRFQGLDVDVRYAATPEQALHGSEAFAGHDLLLVDTPGAAYLDREAFEQVQACLATIGADDVHLVVPLATSSREANALVEAFRELGANRLVVSRLDESRYVGQLLNFGFRLGLPMTYLSRGARANDGLEVASARSITDRILNPDA